ncbi:MAG TPA: ABC transporter substrate-binding protein [Burkholderiales bacterium]|nr:ABC transporter substrate-binding protein [Burkholderiales bacterium]
MLFQPGLGSIFQAWRCELSAPTPQFLLPKVRLAIISEGINTWPLYVAQAKGLFPQAGIDVEVTLTRSSAKQLEELKRGGFDIGFQQCDHVVRAVQQGSDLFMFMALAHAPELTLVVGRQIRSFGDLRGKTIAVDGARSGYALLLRKLLSEKGLETGDYVFEEIGGSRERHDAVRDGSASASLLNPPFDRNLLAEGFGSLGTTAQYFPTYTGSIAATRRSWAKANEATLVGFIQGMHAAFSWLREGSHKEEAIDILRARLDIDSAAVSETFDQFAHRPRPEIRQEGLRQVIDVVWEAENFPLPRGEPRMYMDTTYLAKASRVPGNSA